MVDDRPIVVFDAQCPLCSAHARFILRHDRHARLRVASMQRSVGAGLYRRFGIDPDDPETMIVVEGPRVLRDSDAVLAIWTRLGWPWRLATIARLVPKVLRDAVYRRVARNRYRLFGRSRTCWKARPEWRDRIL